MKDKNESLLKTVLFFAKFSKKEISFLYPFGRQKHLNSTFCSHLILLEKGLEDALEPAEARYSGAFLMAGVTRLELAASGVTGRRSNQLSYTPNSNGV
jgi:hypothetical protein